MELCIYAHPWDLQALGRHGGLARLRDLGFGEVALAVSYHAGRWLTPWGQQGMVRFLEDGTVHFRPRLDTYGELRPLASREVPASGPSPLEQLATDAAAASLRARAWTVLYHNTRLGELHPASCVQNAFGDPYPYALCPAREEVQQYGAALVADLGRHGVQSIEFEALGWLGHRHSSHHDKSSFAADPYTDFLLSQCFCASCCAGMAATAAQAKAPVDVAELQARVRQLLRAALEEGDAMAPGKTTPEASRERLVAELGHAAVMVAMTGHRVMTVLKHWAQLWEICGFRGDRGVLPSVQVAWDALRHSFAPPAIFPSAPDLTITCYGDGPAGIEQALQRFAAMQAPPPLHRRLSIWPRAPQFTTDADLERVAALCREHKIATVAIYHLGLLPWRTVERVAAILRR